MSICIASSLRAVLRGNLNRRQLCREYNISRAHQECFRVAGLLSQNKPVDDVQIFGRIRTLRKQKSIAFVALGDGTTTDIVQAVLTPEQTEGQPSSGKGQDYELKVGSVQTLGQNDSENNPIQPKYQSLEFLRTIPHLRARISSNALLLRLRSEVIASVTKWFQQQGFVQCHTPIITSSDCEGAGEVFSVLSGDELEDKQLQPFFKAPKYLTVSAQLHLEALAQAVDKVWTLSPTFRAEKSDTPRHLSEFYMLEAELCFVDDANQVMDVVQGMLQAIARDLKNSDVVAQLLRSKQMQNESQVSAQEIESRWQGLAAQSWPRITYNEAFEIISETHESGNHQFSIVPKHSDGLAAEHERYLANVVGRGTPVFVTQYPAAQKPFYMMSAKDESNGKNTMYCFDLLVPDLCELVGGSLREHRLHELQAAMKTRGVSGEALEWYNDLRRYGSVTHGGFGLGFDRLLCYLAGVSSVRDVVSFPRYYGRADC